MNRSIPIFIIACFLVFALKAQQPLTHAPKMYKDGKGHLYANKNLGMYLRISTSSDPSAESFLLQSETTPQYTNPFYFDTEGKNTIRTPSQVDPKTKKVVQPVQDLIFDVYADGEAPVVQSKHEGSQKYTTGGKTFYGKGFVLSISATDWTSGVEAIYYSINGAAYQKYTAPIDPMKEGDYTIKYYAVDNVGNMSAESSVSFTLDITSPKTKYEIIGTNDNNILNKNSKIKLSSTDALSGVKNTMYRVDNGPLTVYTAPISIENVAGKDHKLVFYAVDNVNNNNAQDLGFQSQEVEVEQYNFDVDVTGPDAKIEIEGDQHETKTAFYVSPRSKFKVVATDDASGVAKITYALDANAMQEYTTPVNFPQQKGVLKVSYSAEDQVRNVSPLKYRSYYVDMSAPVTGIRYQNPQFFNRDSLFITKKTPIGLFATDDASGAKKTQYAIDGGAFQDFSKNFTIETEGTHKITFKSFDNVNNEEKTKESIVVVDNNAPEIYVNFSITTTGEREKDGQKYPVYPTYTKMYIAATDRYAGTETIFYSINGGALTKYTAAGSVSDVNMFTVEKFYTVKVVAVDKLGNESEKIIKFFVGEGN